jgi:hypothetical protein
MKINPIIPRFYISKLIHRTRVIIAEINPEYKLYLREKHLNALVKIENFQNSENTIMTPINEFISILQEPVQPNEVTDTENKNINNELIHNSSYPKSFIYKTNQLHHSEINNTHLPRLREMPKLREIPRLPSLPDIHDYKIKVIKQEKLLLQKLGEHFELLRNNEEIFRGIFTKVEKVFRHPQNGDRDIQDYSLDLVKKELERRKMARELRFLLFLIF